MTEAWRPFSDEEMRKIIEGERIVVNGFKDDCSSWPGSKGMRSSRDRGSKRLSNCNRSNSARQNGSHHCTQTHSEIKSSSKAALVSRIPKILEEKEEEEDEGCDLVEPVLRSGSVDSMQRQSDSTEVEGGRTRHGSIGEEETGGDCSLEEPTGQHCCIDQTATLPYQHKGLEIHNLTTKQLLHKALSDRAKKTREEVEKLNQIEEELRKLDSMVSSDVTIIRSQIEMASQEYLEAQKRYDKAEREFIGAKLELFSYREKKELLTSHLCTIIESNELRKAHHLSRLMSQLEIPALQLPASPTDVEPGLTDESSTTLHDVEPPLTS